MASINGIKVSGLKKYVGLEGIAFQGYISYKGKRLGFWSQDGYGGPDRYEFNTDELDAVAKEYFKAKGEPDYLNLDCLMGDLLNLIDDEKEYKKGVKKGYKTYVRFTDGYHIQGYYTVQGKETKDTDFHKNIEKECRKTFYKNEPLRVDIFTKPDDFNIVIK